MLRFIVVCLISTVASHMFADEPRMAYFAHSHTFEHGVLVAEITNDTLDASPAWDVDNENPPVSARQAINAAGKVKDILVRDTDDWEWHLESASLRQHVAKKWFWVVTYRASIRRGGLGGGAPYLELPVLMDGKAIQPIKKDAGPKKGVVKKKRKQRAGN